MTDAPADLTAFVKSVRAACGFTDPVEVGMLPNAAHLASGGYHVGPADIRKIGRFDKDYSTRQTRDRTVGGNASSAVDVGDNWPRGGRAAWLRFNNLLVAALKAGEPALAALRGVNFSPDGTARKRYDTANRAQGVVNSTDTVNIHTHLEFWRDTAGTPSRATACARVLQLINTAITGATPKPQGDDMFLRTPNGSIYLAAGGKTVSVSGTEWAGVSPQTFVNVPQTLADKLTAPAAAFTDAQIQAIADKLIASAANGLTPADHAAIVGDLKQALTEGTGA